MKNFNRKVVKLEVTKNRGITTLDNKELKGFCITVNWKSIVPEDFWNSSQYSRDINDIRPVINSEYYFQMIEEVKAK